MFGTTQSPDYFWFWNYLVSNEFRREVHQRWEGKPRFDVISDILTGVMGGLIALTVVVVVAAGLIAIVLK